MSNLHNPDSLKDPEPEEDSKEPCPDCGQPKHQYWWDCPEKKRTHSFIIK